MKDFDFPTVCLDSVDQEVDTLLLRKKKWLALIFGELRLHLQGSFSSEVLSSAFKGFSSWLVSFVFREQRVDVLPQYRGFHPLYQGFYRASFLCKGSPQLSIQAEAEGR